MKGLPMMLKTLVWAIGLQAGLAFADGSLMPTQVLPLYKQECAACHTAYPPGLLPALSWQRVMRGLDQHYGTDASLEPQQVQQLATWLVANAGTYKRVHEAPPEDRLSRSAWFVRKHRKVSAEVWQRPSVKSASQCAACHTRADQGWFDEHQVRIPR